MNFTFKFSSPEPNVILSCHKFFFLKNAHSLFVHFSQNSTQPISVIFFPDKYFFPGKTHILLKGNVNYRKYKYSAGEPVTSWLVVSCILLNVPIKTTR